MILDFQGSLSRTFQDIKLEFPLLSKTKVIFQDFPVLEFSGKNPGLSRIRGTGNPV